MSLSAGIDLGGTKILSAVFNDAWQPVFRTQVATPSDTYDALLSEVVRQVEWALTRTDISTIGLGVPGVLNRKTRVLRAANLTANGHRLSEDLESATGVSISVINDSKAFALSEACLGAGIGYHSVLGISIGTGTASGLVVGNSILSEAAGMAGEIGHMSIPAFVANKYKLPVLSCACGKVGCFETFISGPGLTRLGSAVFGHQRSVAEWLTLCSEEDAPATNLMTLWYEILAEMIAEVMLCYDPECIVFGGGLSSLPEFLPCVTRALDKTSRLSDDLPDLFRAKSQEFSGARGAALQASLSKRCPPDATE